MVHWRRTRRGTARPAAEGPLGTAATSPDEDVCRGLLVLCSSASANALELDCMLTVVPGRPDVPVSVLAELPGDAWMRVRDSRLLKRWLADNVDVFVELTLSADRPRVRLTAESTILVFPVVDASRAAGRPGA